MLYNDNESYIQFCLISNLPEIAQAKLSQKIDSGDNAFQHVFSVKIGISVTESDFMEFA